MYLVLYLAHVEMEDNKYSDNFLREVCEGHKQTAFENAVDRSISEKMGANAQNLYHQGDQFNQTEGWQACLFAAQNKDRWEIN